MLVKVSNRWSMVWVAVISVLIYVFLYSGGGFGRVNFFVPSAFYGGVRACTSPSLSPLLRGFTCDIGGVFGG